MQGKFRGLGVQGKATKPKGPTREGYVVEMEPLAGGQWEAALTEGGVQVVCVGDSEKQAFARVREAMVAARGDSRMRKD